MAFNLRSIMLFICVLGFSLQAQARIRVIFDAINLYVPEGVQLILRSSGENSLLLLKYSKNKGEKTLSVFHAGNMYDGPCSYRQFFDATLKPESSHNCGKRDIYQFIDIFGKSSVWTHPKNHKKYYFFYSEKMNAIRVFVPYPQDKKVFLVESNFLNREQMQQLFIKPDE